MHSYHTVCLDDIQWQNSVATEVINANFTETVYACLWVEDNRRYYMQNDNAYFM